MSVSEPIVRLRAWMGDARAAGVAMPEAATLSTATSDGAPSARTVSVKHVEADPPALVFGTSLASRKSAELEANPCAAVTFWWEPVGRQVRVEGRVEPVDRAEAQEIWNARGRANRLVTLVSRQGQPLAGRRQLEEAFARASERYGDGPIPCPEDWGAFRVVAASIEFWKEGADRLIERELFTRDPDGSWQAMLLQP